MNNSITDNVYLILAFIISIISQASDNLIIILAFIVYTGTNMHMVHFITHLYTAE